MGILYRNRTLVGNISLVVFLAYLVTLTFGAFPGTAAAVTPTLDDSLQQQVTESVPVKVKDKNNNWQGTSATVQTSSDGRQVTLTVQVLTPDAFNNILLDLVGVGQVAAQNVTSATYKAVYGTVYNVYQLVYTWVYGSALNVGSASDYTLKVYSGNSLLKSITLDLENPPPQSGGGGGGGGGSTPPAPTTTTTTDTGTVTTSGNTSTLTVDQAKVDAVVADTKATTVELAVPAAANVTTAAVPVTVEQLTRIFEAKKDVAVSFGEVKLTFPPGALDLSALAGQNATVKFEISKVAESQVSGAAGAALKIAGDVYELNVRVLAGDADKGGIHSFSKPVTVNLPYDPAKLGGVSEDKLGVYRFNETNKAWDYAGGKVDKVNKSVAVALNSFSKYAVMAFQKTFTDLTGHWAKADVDLMAARHIVKGVTETAFGPDLNVTRAQFAAFLQRSLKLAEDKSAAGRFADVQGGDWFAGAVGAAAKANLIKGYEDGTFRPNQLITRQEVAAMVTRALSYSGKGVAMTPAEVESTLAGFSDTGAIGSWAKEAVAAAVKQGIVYGRTAGLFDPASNATRAEGVVMLKRMLTSSGAL